jgi:ribosomal protein L15E
MTIDNPINRIHESEIHGNRNMRTLRQSDRQAREMRLLHQGHLLSMHKEPEAEEDRPQDNLQGLLVEYEQEKAVQKRELTDLSILLFYENLLFLLPKE